MNPELFQQAQSSVAEQMLGDEVLSAHSKGKKLLALAGASFRKVGAAVGLGVVLASAAPMAAHAQTWSSWNPQAVTVSVQDAQQARAQAENLRRQQEAEARNKAQVDAQTTRVLADVAGGIARQTAFSQGMNYNQAASAEQLARVGVNVVNGRDGQNTAQRVGIGALVATTLTGLTQKNTKNAGRNAAIAGGIGAAAGYAWDMVANSNKAAEEAQQQQQILAQQQRAQPQQNVQRQLVVHDPAAMGMPQLVVEVAASRRMGIVEPGNRPLPQSHAEIERDPLLNNMVSALALATHHLTLRNQAQQNVANARLNVNTNQIEIGQAAKVFAEKERDLREAVGLAIEHMNNAAAKGGYDTRVAITALGQIAGNNYTPDAQTAYRVNTSTGYRP